MKASLQIKKCVICGTRDTSAECPACHKESMSPEWRVIDRRGVIQGGFVYGGTVNEALDSALQQPDYDRLGGFTVIEST